jgi:hypothetical protein
VTGVACGTDNANSSNYGACAQSVPTPPRGSAGPSAPPIEVGSVDTAGIVSRASARAGTIRHTQSFSEDPAPVADVKDRFYL